MKHSIQILALVFSLSTTLTSIVAQAATATATKKIVCSADQGRIKIEALVSNQTIKAKISDYKDSLSIRELSVGEVVELSSSLRKKEAQYSFAKFYVDFNAWQDLELSVPKDLFKLQKNTRFTSYFVVYIDNGDMMAPLSTTKLSCLAQ